MLCCYILIFFPVGVLSGPGNVVVVLVNLQPYLNGWNTFWTMKMSSGQGKFELLSVTCNISTRTIDIEGISSRFVLT